MRNFFPEKVFVETAAANLERTKEILRKLGGKEITFVEDYRGIDFTDESVDARFSRAKKCLAIAVKKGDMVKEFRRHPALRQGREYYLFHAANCPFDCSYCYLQCYFENAVPTIFVNTDELFGQVEHVLKEERDRKILFHAGETADAFALEHLSGFAADAVQFFAQTKNGTLELRTKSANVDSILPLAHNGHTVVSWTLTPRRIAEKYEIGAASLKERLRAASRCRDAGYPIGLRLDPLIHYDGWRGGYAELIEEIFRALDPEQIHSIVFGAFRFPPALSEILVARLGRDPLVLGEFVLSPDGKLRYFRHIREEMYRYLIGMFRDRCGKDYLRKIALAMEPEYVWKNVGLSAGEVSC